jgi:spore coat protein A, manganese oxidase
LKAGALAGAGLVLPVGALSVPVGCLMASSSVRSPDVEPFTVPSPVPVVARPVHTHGGADHYEIVQEVARQEILPGLRTEVWGYDGIFPGPAIEARRDRPVVIRQINELPVPVSVHLHGGKTPPESESYPTDLILPRGTQDHRTHAHGGHVSGVDEGSREYRYPNGHRAAALWYHDHRMDFTGPQVYRGHAGMYVLRDEVEDSLPIPRGEREVPLVICDRTFLEDGSFYYPSLDPTLQDEPGVLAHAANGMYGDTILVNGTPWPQLEVSNTMHRLRILNASNARSYDLALDPRRQDGPLPGKRSLRLGRSLHAPPARRWPEALRSEPRRPGLPATQGLPVLDESPGTRRSG